MTQLGPRIIRPSSSSRPAPVSARAQAPAPCSGSRRSAPAAVGSGESTAAAGPPDCRRAGVGPPVSARSSPHTRGPARQPIHVVVQTGSEMQQLNNPRQTSWQPPPRPAPFADTSHSPPVPAQGSLTTCLTKLRWNGREMWTPIGPWKSGWNRAGNLARDQDLWLILDVVGRCCGLDTVVVHSPRACSRRRPYRTLLAGSRSCLTNAGILDKSRAARARNLNSLYNADSYL